MVIEADDERSMIPVISARNMVRNKKTPEHIIPSAIV